MILPDINLLLYATDQGSPYHERARAWWHTCMNGEEPVALAVAVASGFVRLSTRASAFPHPLTVALATGLVESWLSRPQVVLVAAGAAELRQALRLLRREGTGGNLVGDAVLAALAMAHDATVYSADADFSRLRPAKWRNPLRY